MIREVIRTFKAILHERRRNVRDWVDLVPALQWALNTAYREHSKKGSTSYHIMFGTAPYTTLTTVASSSGDACNVNVLDIEALKQHVSHIVEAQTVLHKGMLTKVVYIHARQRNAAGGGRLPNVAVDDYVMVARVCRSGLILKLASIYLDRSVGGDYGGTEARVRCEAHYLQ